MVDLCDSLAELVCDIFVFHATTMKDQDGTDKVAYDSLDVRVGMRRRGSEVEFALAVGTDLSLVRDAELVAEATECCLGTARRNDALLGKLDFVFSPMGRLHEAERTATLIHRLVGAAR